MMRRLEHLVYGKQLTEWGLVNLKRKNQSWSHSSAEIDSLGMLMEFEAQSCQRGKNTPVQKKDIHMDPGAKMMHTLGDHRIEKFDILPFLKALL
ncbi:hypothetical protein DUI87_07492 [Hirundo rustica rustica]|uniref:Uncharacterized protein n=1 Tax=Hirundo rustica rustica TaxID=333673 RepID=A0A3M0KQC1_HIRRU|nr:hypothetical protein DUI87_07492 [Hirundo rustica rustica]